MNDAVREYTSAEDETLARNLHGVVGEIHEGRLIEREASIELLCDIHRAIFQGVRSHAGRHRQRGVGAEHLVFGPNRSVDRNAVPEQLEKIFHDLRHGIASLRDAPDDPGYEESAIRLAVLTHAEVVRVHPFEDGNGRSARALMNWILVLLDLRPIAIEVPKQEYHDCLNRYYKAHDPQPLLDLSLSLYPLRQTD